MGPKPKSKLKVVRGSKVSPTSFKTPVHRCHPEALRYTQGKNFAKTKMELARRLHELYNREIFGAALPHDMPIDWNVRLTKTAGLCYSRRERKYNVETRTA